MRPRAASHRALLGLLVAGAITSAPHVGEPVAGKVRASTPTGPRTWPVRLVIRADLEGPPVVLPGTSEAFALKGNDGEEVASEPLERVDLLSGHVGVGPRVPGDADVAVVGARLVVVAPSRYTDAGSAVGPWRISTVDPGTLRPDRSAILSFVTGYGVTIAPVDAAPDGDHLWVSNGSALQLVDLSSDAIIRTVRVPALSLSIDPTGRRLYVLTGSGGARASGGPYRTGTIVELDARTGAVVAATDRWTHSPDVRVSAAPAGVFLTGTGSTASPVVLLDERDLEQVDVPATLESSLGRSLQPGRDVTVTSDGGAIFIGTRGELTCVNPGATGVLASTALDPRAATWMVIGQLRRTLFIWSVSSSTGASSIEAITPPSSCAS